MLRMTFQFEDSVDEQKVVDQMHAAAEQVAEDLDTDYELDVEVVPDSGNGMPVDQYGRLVR